MNKSGLVVDTLDGMARVMFIRAAGCGGNCKSCASCESKEHTIELPNSVNARIGDTVEVSANSSSIVRLTILLYAVPLLFFIVGTVVGVLLFQNRVDAYELYSFLTGVAFFGLSVFVLRYFDKRYGGQDSTKMVITKIL